MEGSATARQIRSLREGIARIDRAILLLLLTRQKNVREMFDAKVRSGWALEDRAQEWRVIYRARGWADDLGLSPEFVERVLRLVIEEAKRDGSKHLAEASDPSNLDPVVEETSRPQPRETSAVTVPVAREP